MTTKTFSDEQILFYHQIYLEENKSLISFAKKNKLSSSALRNGFKRLNLEIISQTITKRKFPINENYFELIDTEEKAYFLGFLYADACNTPSKNRLEISLAKQDRDILEKLSRTLLNDNINILEYKSKKKNVQDKIGLFIINKKISQDLVKWGCTSRKTFTLKFPNIDPNLHNHFIRGYFDGDGMLTFSEKLQKCCKNKTKTANFSILSTKEMLDEIGKILNNLDVRFYINKRHKNKKTNNFTLRVFGNQQIKKVCDFLYKDATIFLNRKYLKNIELLEMSKTFRKEYVYV